MKWPLSATKCVSDVTCVEGVHDFTSSVLMSIELMQTIGYGQRATTEKVNISMEKIWRIVMISYDKNAIFGSDIRPGTQEITLSVCPSVVCL